MNKQFLAIALILSIAYLTGVAFAGKVPAGSMIIRLPDRQRSHCINTSNDEISLHLRRFIIQKDIGWFSEDTEIGLLLEITFGGKSQDEERKITFPLMFKASIEAFDRGIVSLPVEQRIFNSFKLTNGPNTYTNVDVAFTVLKKKERAHFGIALEQLAYITKQLPLPPNPYSQAFSYFVGYSNAVVSQSLDSRNNVSDQLKEGQISLAFSLNGQCKGDFENTGTIAVIRGSQGAEAEGYIDFSRDYCWDSQLKPNFELRFAKKPANGNCGQVTEYQKVKNPYYGFYLNAVPILKPVGLTPVADPDLREALGRCIEHGIEEDKCL